MNGVFQLPNVDYKVTAAEKCGWIVETRNHDDPGPQAILTAAFSNSIDLLAWLTAEHARFDAKCKATAVSTALDENVERQWIGEPMPDEPKAVRILTEEEAGPDAVEAAREFLGLPSSRHIAPIGQLRVRSFRRGSPRNDPKSDGIHQLDFLSADNARRAAHCFAGMGYHAAVTDEEGTIVFEVMAS